MSFPCIDSKHFSIRCNASPYLKNMHHPAKRDVSCVMCHVPCVVCCQSNIMKPSLTKIYIKFNLNLLKFVVFWLFNINFSPSYN